MPTMMRLFLFLVVVAVSCTAKSCEGVAKSNCSVLTVNSTACVKDEFCEWDHSACESKPCSVFASREACEKATGCKWDDRSEVAIFAIIGGCVVGAIVILVAVVVLIGKASSDINRHRKELREPSEEDLASYVPPVPLLREHERP